MKIQDNNYYKINGWFITQLGLKGTRLQVYAIIYSYYETSRIFSGSIAYLCNFIGASKPTIIKALADLTKDNLIKKETNRYGCKYEIVENNTVKKFNHHSKETLPPSKETLPNNNIYNNNYKEKDYIEKENSTNTLISLNEYTPKRDTTKKKDTTNIKNNKTDNTNNRDKISIEEINLMFEKTYKELYPRKVGKVQASKTYTHKLIGLSTEEGKQKANMIYTMLKKQNILWNKEERTIKYIPHFSTWLNDNIEDSPYKR